MQCTCQKAQENQHLPLATAKFSNAPAKLRASRNRSKSPAIARVTLNTRRKIIAAKRSLSVVTRHATAGSWRRVVVERNGRRHRRQRRPGPVTIIATQSFRRIMFRMTEPNSKCRGLFGRANKTSQLMTSAARRDVTPVHLCRRRMTTETRYMSIHPRRDRERHTAAKTTHRNPPCPAKRRTHLAPVVTRNNLQIRTARSARSATRMLSRER